MERLNKFLAHAGIGSRRKCEQLIVSGRVAVDGTVVRDLGTKVDPEQQEVQVNNTKVKPEKQTWWVVNKPKGYICSNHDPAKRPLAVDLIPDYVSQRVYTVGRLDEQSEGLLLLTNDGELANRLMHPRYGVGKTYLVQVAGNPTRDELQQLLDGIWLSDGRVKAKSVSKLRKQGESTWLKIVLNEGKNREIRRMLAKLDHKVMKLKRVSIGPVRMGNLKPGKCRRLTHDEVEALQRISRRAPIDAGEETTERQEPRKPRRPGKPNRRRKPTSREDEPVASRGKVRPRTRARTNETVPGRGGPRSKTNQGASGRSGPRSRPKARPVRRRK